MTADCQLTGPEQRVVLFEMSREYYGLDLLDFLMWLDFLSEGDMVQ